MRRIFRLSLIVVIFLICVVSYLLFTTVGSKFLARLILSKYVDSKKMTIERIEGNLARGLKLGDIQIKDLAGLPKGTALKIQQINVSFRPFKFDTLNLDIENARLDLPYSDPIVLFASYKKVELDVNVYSRMVDAGEVFNLFVKDKQLDDISGAITNIDSYVKGSFTNPQLMGVFEVEKISYKDLTLSNCPGSFAINLIGKAKDSSVQGAIVFQSGELLTRDINIAMGECKIIFSPEEEEPIFDFKGLTGIKDTEIDITVRGKLSNPDLRLVSRPPQPPAILAFMLVTGKSVQNIEEEALNQVSLDKDLARDLIDYFLSETTSEEIMKRLGVERGSQVNEEEQSKLQASDSQELILEIEDEIKESPSDSGRSE